MVQALRLRIKGVTSCLIFSECFLIKLFWANALNFGENYFCENKLELLSGLTFISKARAKPSEAHFWTRRYKEKWSTSKKSTDQKVNLPKKVNSLKTPNISFWLF